MKLPESLHHTSGTECELTHRHESFESTAFDGQKLINLERYPLDIPGAAYVELVAQVRAQLAKDGCAVLQGFLSNEGINALVSEVDGVSHCGHQSRNHTNPYFTQDDPELPIDDPRRRFFERSNNFIPADNFHESGALRTIHDYPAFDPFICDCLHRVAPLSGSTPRYVAIFSYVEEPNMVGTPERSRQLYGRALPIHYKRAGLRQDRFLD